MSDGDMQRKLKMEGSSRSLREKHLTAPVRIKVVYQGHGLSQDVFESPTLRWVDISSKTIDLYLLNKTETQTVNHTLGVGWTQ
jgi:hypothetical protein